MTPNPSSKSGTDTLFRALQPSESTQPSGAKKGCLSPIFHDTIEYFTQPRVIAVESFFGLDLGQVHDPSAIAILESSEILIGRSRVTYDWVTIKRNSFR